MLKVVLGVTYLIKKNYKSGIDKMMEKYKRELRFTEDMKWKIIHFGNVEETRSQGNC